MANTIKLKRGDTTPTTSDIVDGEVAIDKTAKKLYINDDGTIKEIGGGTGVSNGVLTLEGVQPKINFTDSGDNPDYALIADAGLFAIGDVTNNTVRFQVNSDGHIDISGNLDVGNGIDVLDGNITLASGHTVDGRDVSADGTKLDGIESNATADQTASEIKTLLQSDKLTSNEIADGAIGSAKISDGAIVNNDISSSAGISISKLGILSANTLVGRRVSNGTPQELTASQVRTILNVEDGATGDQTASEIVALIASQTIAPSALSNGVTATTQSAGDNSTKVATTAYADTAISNLVDSSPSTLNTLNELAAALGDDANFSTTVTNSIATKLPKAGGTITGNLQVNGTITGNGNIQLGDASSETVTFTAVVDSDIYPEVTGTHDLGNQFQKWDNVHANTFTGNAATSTKLATARTIAGASFDGSANINISFDDLTNKPTIPTNNNQLTNGAGYVTSNTQLSNEQVQDIVGAMVSGNSESGITVTYQDSDGTIDFSVASQTDNNFTTALKNKLDGIAAGATNVTNNNQLTNGAGYVTSNTQLSNEQVQDIVGAMVSGNSESGITVTYQDSDGTLDFSVSSQTDNNFTTALKNKLDGIAASATNVTNNNQLTNGAGYITASNSAVTNKMPKSGGTFTGIVSNQFSTSSGVLQNLYNTNNAHGASIAFSDHSSQSQIGFFEYFHADGVSNGCANSFHFDSNQTSTAVIIDQTAGNSGFYVGTNEVFHEGNDGSGSGLDADKLDGQQGSHYLDYNNFNNTPSIPTNNNQLTNGAGYVTANTQLSTEQVQDIVGAMVSGNSESNISVTYNDSGGKLNFSATNTNTQLSNEQVQDIVGAMVSSNSESGITVTYQDADGTLDFSVASQTDQNFTTALKNKLDGIATGANNITNNNQLTNGAGYVTSNTQLSNEQVQDIVGGMVSGNSESGITVTYQDSDGTLDFSVSSQTDNNFTNALKTKLDGIASSATNVTNNNQLTNGAGYITSQRSVESVQDIVGAMVSSNSESGISVTYQDSDGTLDFSVSSQTDQNFTTALKNKLDGIASSATNVTNNNQLTNGAGYITSSNSAITNKLPLAGGTITGSLNVGSLKLGSQVKEVFNNINNKLSNAPNIDVNSGNVHFFSGQSESANATPNIRGNSSTSLNSVLAIGETITVSIVIVASGSGFYQNVTVDGSNPSFKRWLNDSEPSVAASSGDFEIYTYTILKTANALFTVLCNRSVFK